MVDAHTPEQLTPRLDGRQRGNAVVSNPNGLHMRPAMAFVRAAQQYTAAVTVFKGKDSVNGKSLIELMMLAAESGTELAVEVVGPDADAALPVLLELLSSPAAEEIDAE